jgi:hypothetical protein
MTAPSDGSSSRLQQRALAAAGGADNEHHLAFADDKVDPLQDFDRSERLAESVQLEHRSTFGRHAACAKISVKRCDDRVHLQDSACGASS